MKVIRIVSAIIGLASFAAACRFASHGFALHDNQCLVLAGLAILVGALLLWFAFRKRPERG